MYDPTVGYYSSHLWLPKKGGLNLAPIKNSLTFTNERTTFNAWKDAGTHIRVPRETIPFNDYRTLPFKVMDIRPQSVQSVQNIFPTFPLRDYQEPAVEAMLKHGSGIISLACGRGKTVIAIQAALCSLKYPTFVVVPSVDLAYQWKARILEHTNLEEHEIGWAQGPLEKWIWHAKPIVIGIVNSVAMAAKKWDENSRNDYSTAWDQLRTSFGCWIYDECHRLGAELFNHAAGIGFGWRWGLSATPYRGDGNEELFKAHLGSTLYSDLTQPYRASIYFLNTRIELSEAGNRECLDWAGELNLAKLKSYLSMSEERDKIIQKTIKTIRDSGRKLLVLSDRVSEVLRLHNAFPESGVIIGNTKGNEREEELKKGLVFASTKIAREGLDKKGLNTLLILYPFTDKGKFIQTIGRAQRGPKPKVFILQDQIGIHIAMCKRLQRLCREIGYPLHRIDVNEVRRSVEGL